MNETRYETHKACVNGNGRLIAVCGAETGPHMADHLTFMTEKVTCPACKGERW